MKLNEKAEHFCLIIDNNISINSIIELPIRSQWRAEFRVGGIYKRKDGVKTDETSQSLFTQIINMHLVKSLYACVFPVLIHRKLPNNSNG